MVDRVFSVLEAHREPPPKIKYVLLIRTLRFSFCSTNVCGCVRNSKLIHHKISTTTWPTKTLDERKIVIVLLPRINASNKLSELVHPRFGRHCLANVILVATRLDQVLCSTSACLYAQLLLLFCCCFAFHAVHHKVSLKLVNDKIRGRCGIRTHGSFRFGSLVNFCLKPLGQPSR
jgi:hypothetical protein